MHISATLYLSVHENLTEIASVLGWLTVCFVVGTNADSSSPQNVVQDFINPLALEMDI
jgi:hypothetical protein